MKQALWEETMIVLVDRRCGRPEQGGLYAVSRMVPGGGLLPFTALAAPHPATIRNPRRPEVVDTARTLTADVGLWAPDPAWEFEGRFAGLPRKGLGDYWGQAAGYVNVWDVIQETRQHGVCRRVADIPRDLPLPAPVIMLHAEVVVDCRASWTAVQEWLRRQGIDWADVGAAAVGWDHNETAPPLELLSGPASVDDQPWREAESLGRSTDDSFLWHSYCSLWQALVELKERRLFAQFQRDCGARISQAAFGLGWITDFAMVLEPGQDEVPERWARRGVIAAVTEDDPRAAA